MSADSFFSRWSKRKRAEKSDALSAPDITPKIEPMGSSPTAPRTADESLKIATNTSTDGKFAAKMPEIALQTDTLPNEPAEKKPLPPVESLNAQSDFTPFMASDVSPALRNQAMKLLFTDPHYNVMDRLDTYIDDYGKPDPLPADWLKKMNQSKALRLFDDEEKVATRIAGNTDAAVDTTQHNGPAVPEPLQLESQDATAPVQETGRVDVATIEPGIPVDVKSQP
ncbi:MAG: DUF3306 domain-containing protein [Pseudomonadota bacterium]